MDKETRGRETFQKYKKLILILVKLTSVIPLNHRIKLFNNIRNCNGVSGLTLRYILLKSISKKCGDNVSIHSGVYLFNPKNIIIGDNVSIHPMCYIDAKGEIQIENDVSIAHSTTIMSTEHIYADVDELIKDQGCSVHKTIIKSNVWIGAGCRILAGSIINEGTIVGAGSVVKSELESDCIYGGIPAKLIKRRKHI